MQIWNTYPSFRPAKSAGSASRTHLHDVVQAGADSLENGLAIRQRLSCLTSDRVSSATAGARVDADNAREEQVRSCMDSQAVEGRTRSPRGRDDPRCHLGPPDLPATFPTKRSQVSCPGAVICQPHTDSTIDHCNLRVEVLQHRPSDLPPFTKSPRAPVRSSATPPRCRRSTRRRLRSRL
jgi:hypothetical protein